MPTISGLKRPVLMKAEGLDLSKFLILDGRIGSYPDLYIAKLKTNFGLEKYDAHKSLYETDSDLFMTVPRMLMDLISDLKSGKQLYAGNGKKINSKGSEQILDEIVGLRNPLRGEWLDAEFKVVNNKLHINYNHRFVNGQLKPQNSEPLEDCLMEDCYIDILSANRQGLPARRSNSKGVYYRYPRNGALAGFVAGSGGADLICYRDPRGSCSWLGVRVAKNKE